jgi:hypothetical protein
MRPKETIEMTRDPIPGDGDAVAGTCRRRRSRMSRSCDLYLCGNRCQLFDILSGRRWEAHCSWTASRAVARVKVTRRAKVRMPKTFQKTENTMAPVVLSVTSPKPTVSADCTQK